MTHHLAPWQPREQASALDLVATARRLGHALHVEERLFEITGRWVVETSDARLKERLAAHCHAHASHVALWRARLPQAAGLDTAAMVASPGAGVDRALELMSTPTHTVWRLTGLYRVVVPRLVAAHGFHRHITNALTDGPTASLLETVIADLVREWREGEMMIETLVSEAAAHDDVDVEALAGHQAAVERSLISAGGILGPGTLGNE